jgi:phosphohistidine phosphatase
MTVLPKVLIFVRHAIAVDAEDFDGPDAERPLTKKGVKKATKVFTKLVEHYRPTRIVTSPYVRARDTAQLLKDALAGVDETGDAGPPVILTSALTPDATWDDWRAELASGKLGITADDVVCVVGHEPSLGLFFCRHIGFSEAIPFKKAGIGVIEPETLTRARLIAFAPARFFKG